LVAGITVLVMHGHTNGKFNRRASNILAPCEKRARIVVTVAVLTNVGSQIPRCNDQTGSQTWKVLENITVQGLALDIKHIDYKLLVYFTSYM